MYFFLGTTDDDETFKTDLNEVSFVDKVVKNIEIRWVLIKSEFNGFKMLF